MNAAQMEAPVRCFGRIPRAVSASRDLVIEVGREGKVIVKRRGCQGEGMGVSLERGGVPSEVDPARGPAHRVTGTQGTGRGGRRGREPWRTMGTRCRVLRGGKGGCRAFGWRLQGKGGGRGQTMLAEGIKGSRIRHTRCRRSRGCQTLGTRQGRGQRGGRGVTGHGDRADGEDRGDRSRGGDHRGGSTANCSRGNGSMPTSRRG